MADTRLKDVYMCGIHGKTSSNWVYFTTTEDLPYASNNAVENLLKCSDMVASPWPDVQGGARYLREITVELSNVWIGGQINSYVDEWMIGENNYNASAFVQAKNTSDATWVFLIVGTVKEFVLGPTITVKIVSSDYLSDTDIPFMRLTDNLTGQLYCSTAAQVPQTDVGKYVPYCVGEAKQVPAVLWNIMPRVLKFEASCTATTASAYRQIWSSSYSIVTGDTLEYDVMVDDWTPDTVGVGGADIEGAAWTGRGTYTLVDQNSQSLHNPTITNYAHGKWYHRTISLSAANGQTMTKVDLAYEAETAGNYIAYYANIKITNGTTTKLLIYPTSDGKLEDNQNASAPANYGSIRVTEAQIYDYLVHDGQSCRVHNVYRNNKLVNAGEYNVWCGRGSSPVTTQGSYPNKTFIRFYKEQLDYGMAPCQISADLCTESIHDYTNVVDGVDNHYDCEYDYTSTGQPDWSGYGNHIPTYWGVGVARASGGKLGTYCYYWNGSGHYLAFPRKTKLDWHHAFSFAAWVKTDYTTATQVVFSTFNTGGKGIEFQITTAGKIRLYILQSGTDYILVTGNTTVSGGATWRHIACTYDGSGRAKGVKLYVNGSSETVTYDSDTLVNGKFTYGGAKLIPSTVAQPASTTGVADDTFQVFLGQRYSIGGYAFYGYMDQVLMYRMMLTSGKVSLLYNSGNGYLFTHPSNRATMGIYGLLKKVGVVASSDTFLGYASTRLTTTTNYPAYFDAYYTSHCMVGGYVSELQKVSDVLFQLLQLCWANAQWDAVNSTFKLSFDSAALTSSGSFAAGDGYLENIASLGTRTFKTHVNPVKTVKLAYWFQPWKGDMVCQREFAVLAAGEDLSITNRFVGDSVTANLLGGYIAGKLKYASERWPVVLKYDALVTTVDGSYAIRTFSPGKVITISVYGYGHNGVVGKTYRILEATYRQTVADVALEPFVSTAYDYQASSNTVYLDSPDPRALAWSGDANADNPAEQYATITVNNGSYATTTFTHQLTRKPMLTVKIVDSAGNPPSNYIHTLVTYNEADATGGTIKITTYNNSGSAFTNGVLTITYW